MITNHQPLSASLAASFAIHPPFSPFRRLKATSSVSSPGPGVPSSRNVSVSLLFAFRLPIQLGSTKPPTFRRSSPIRNPPFTHDSFVNPILVWREDISFFERSNRVSIPSSSPSRLSTKHQVVLIILTQTTAPNSRSSLIHQLLGVTLVVAAVSLQHKSVTGVFVQAQQLGRRIVFLLVCSPFSFSVSRHSSLPANSITMSVS